jgi:predicted MFS family arabinose efflux permease
MMISIRFNYRSEPERLGAPVLTSRGSVNHTFASLPEEIRCGRRPPFMSVVADDVAVRQVRASPSVVLFSCVFTSQAAVLVLAPILVSIARDLDVSTALAGQLRIFGAPVAAVVAIALARHGGRLPLQRLLLASSAFVALGAIASAAAPSFLTLALAQVPLWIGVAGLVAGGIGAAGAWSDPDTRTRVVARALAGAPAAWVVGMPTIGAVADSSWRLAFLAVPLPAAIVTAALVVTSAPKRARERQETSLVGLLDRRGARGWALGELLAMSGWAGTLVFSGAVFIETYGTSTDATGVLLALIALAYLVGNSVGGRIGGSCVMRRALAQTTAAAAIGVAALTTFTPNVFVTFAFFALSSALVGARTVAGTTYGFTIAGERKLEVGTVRAVSTHAGYLIGSAVGGAAYALGGVQLTGVALASLLLAGALPHASMWRASCSAPAAEPVLGGT